MEAAGFVNVANNFYLYIPKTVIKLEECLAPASGERWHLGYPEAPRDKDFSSL